MTHRVGLFVFDGFTLLDASGPAEVLTAAGVEKTFYEIVMISEQGGTVTSVSGLSLADTTAADQIDSLDTLIVAGGPALVEPNLHAGMLNAVSRLVTSAPRVASVCTGAFLLAALGLLDGRSVTTHWRHAGTLRQRYSRVTVDPEVIHIRDGRFVTSAGITAGMDLALSLVEEDLGAETARVAARELVMFMQRPGGQSQFSAALDHDPSTHPHMRTMMDEVIADPADEHSVSSMATTVGVSPRHLARIFNTDMGISPARWLERVRLDRAQAYLLDGLPITRVAQRSGFGSDETLRRAFARHFKTTPTECRDRFASTRRPPISGTSAVVMNPQSASTCWSLGSSRRP